MCFNISSPVCRTEFSLKLSSPSYMFVSVVSSIRSSTLHRPDRTAEDGPGEVGELVHDAGVVTLSVESEGKQTGSLYAVSLV